jgi:hypothetical protein
MNFHTVGALPLYWPHPSFAGSGSWESCTRSGRTDDLCEHPLANLCNKLVRVCVSGVTSSSGKRRQTLIARVEELIECCGRATSQQARRRAEHIDHDWFPTAMLQHSDLVVAPGTRRGWPAKVSLTKELAGPTTIVSTFLARLENDQPRPRM